MANDPPKKYVMLPGQSHFLDSESPYSKCCSLNGSDVAPWVSAK